MEVKQGITSHEIGHASLFSKILSTVKTVGVSTFMMITPLTLIIIKYARQLKILSMQHHPFAEASVDQYKSS